MLESGAETSCLTADVTVWPYTAVVNARRAPESRALARGVRAKSSVRMASSGGGSSDDESRAKQGQHIFEVVGDGELPMTANEKSGGAARLRVHDEGTRVAVRGEWRRRPSDEPLIDELQLPQIVLQG